ncbi:MAG: translocation/assembly module TamB domain-containing protein [Candidatus Baltobacteraceae bacterium]
MRRTRGGRVWGAVTIALLLLAGLAIWQWETLARWAIVAAVEHFAGVRVSFGPMTLAPDRAVFEDVRVESLRDEPIAEIARLVIAYDLRDLFPGGQRRFGLKAVDVETPHVTIIRRPDGSYNIPAQQPPAAPAKNQRPWILAARLTNGSAEVIDRSRNAAPGQQHLYVERLDGAADISTAARSTYGVALQYGERRDRLFPLRGQGVIDPPLGTISHHWTAAELPIAAAVNFVLNSPELRLRAGTLHGVDARYAALGEPGGALAAHLFASATLAGGTIALAGLSKPIEEARGRLDVYDDALLTERLDASVANVPARLTGGLYGLRDPRLRMAVQGDGDLAQLRTAFAQAEHLPMRGPLDFALLVTGKPTKPLVWISLRSPGISYAGAALDRLRGSIALDGGEANVLGAEASYHRVEVAARGHAALQTETGAIVMLARAQSPPGALPYADSFLPGMSLNGFALATADDPKAIATRGVLRGTGAAHSLDALFNVDSRGRGSIGPLEVRGGGGSLYARLTLDRPHGSSVGLFDARNFQVPPARATLSAVLFGGQAKPGIALGGNATLAGAWGTALARGALGFEAGRLAGGISGSVARSASFAATLAGTLQSPLVSGAVAAAGSRYRDFDVNGNAGFSFADRTLHLHDAAVAIGPLFVAVAGTVGNLISPGSFAPHYDVAAQLHSSDLRSLLAGVQPRAAALVQGSLDADMRVHGTGVAPIFAGTMSAPEASINGLAIRDLRGSVRGDRTAIALSGGRATVGTTALAFRGTAEGTAKRFAVIAPQSDLADFNDLFDAGDTFAGTGKIAVAASVTGTRLVATAGAAMLAGARFRRLEFGDVAARWGMHDRSVVSALWFGGPNGEVRVAGSILPQTMSVNLNAAAREVDLSAWLPMLELQVPVTGRLGAQANVAGRYPDITMKVHASIDRGTAGPLPIERFDINASASHGRGTIQSAALDVPFLKTEASGAFGFGANDPLSLVARSVSPNVGAFLDQATGKHLHISGTLDATMQVHGTRERPRVRADVVLQSLTHEKFTIPRVAAELDADRHWAAVRNGEIDFEHGRALANAEFPISVGAAGIRPGNGSIAATLTAEAVELSNFLPLLPQGTELSGHVNGSIAASGTVAHPALNGSLALADGTFGGPYLEKTPITKIGVELAFSGTQAKLQSQATAGGGTLALQGQASVSNLRQVADSSFSLRGRSDNVRFDLPGFFRGNLDAQLAVAREYAATPLASGDVSVSNARIPPNAFLPRQGGAESRPALPNVAFRSVRIAAGNDVRLQNSNVDVGATGEVVLGGTLADPRLAGSFKSTGGTLSFYRTFNLERGEVAFAPSSGVIPDITASATTFVANPATAIRLHVTGPATSMNLKMESQPPYSQEQILGLLVGAQTFGAVQGVQSTGTAFNPGQMAGNIALGQLNTLFTRTVLQPFSASLGGALGFTEVQLTTDIQTGLGVRAVKALGPVNAIFAQTFGFPRTTSFTLEATPGVCSGLRLIWFTSDGPTLLALQQPQPLALDVVTLRPVTTFVPNVAQNGVALSYLRKLPCIRGFL